MTPEPGWQQPPVQIKPSPKTCPHLGLIGAQFGIIKHPEGHEWVCTCGKVFVVVSNGGKGRRLVAK